MSANKQMPRIQRFYETPDGCAHFVTFSCHKRRRWLSLEQPKRIVLGILCAELRKQRGHCVGFVLMPNHVHILMVFEQAGRLSGFLKQWKQRTSHGILEFYSEDCPRYLERLDADHTVWLPRYYPFRIETEEKLHEKLVYMHENPVRAGLVEDACDWPWSSARYYRQGKPVGVPIRKC
ncbi:MAG: transposase [Planctomycetes bacterium]|nr:transposase [Planctomycetota bacterium]